MAGFELKSVECGYNRYSLQRGTARGLNVDDSFQCLPYAHDEQNVPQPLSQRKSIGDTMLV